MHSSQPPLAIENLPRYYRARELSALPSPSSAVDFSAIESALEAAQLGQQRIRMRMFISANGEVEQVQFDGVPLNAALREQLVNVFRATPFTPGRLGQRPVPSVVEVFLGVQQSASETAPYRTDH